MNHETLDQARDIFRTVRSLQERLARQFDRIHKENVGGTVCTDLTFPQCNTMMVIHEREVVTIKELSNALQVSPPSASAMVDRLVEMGMLLREQSKSDRREVQVRLSDNGAQSIQFMEEQFLSTISDLLHKLGPEMASQWCGVYARIREHLKAETDAEISVAPKA